MSKLPRLRLTSVVHGSTRLWRRFGNVPVLVQDAAVAVRDRRAFGPYGTIVVHVSTMRRSSAAAGTANIAAAASSVGVTTMAKDGSPWFALRRRAVTITV